MLIFNPLMKKIPFSFILLFVFLVSISYAQEGHKFKHIKTGFQVNRNDRDNFYFNNKDYSFAIFTLKFQSFYEVKKIKNWSFNVILQPQFQYIEHQLLNKFFITPEDFNGDYLEWREKLTQPNNFSFYAFELGFQLTRPLYKTLNFEFTAGLGAGYIDFFTERVASGFTFLENLSFGFSKTFSKNEIYLGFVLNHISNFGFKSPNSGYNTLGFELSYRFF